MNKHVDLRSTDDNKSPMDTTSGYLEATEEAVNSARSAIYFEISYPTNKDSSNEEINMDDQIKSKLQKNGEYFGPPATLKIYFEEFSINSENSIVGASMEEFMIATSGIRRKKYESTKNCHLLLEQCKKEYQKLLESDMYSMPGTEEYISKNPGTYSNHQRDNTFLENNNTIPIWLIPFIWEIAITPRILFVRPASLIWSLCRAVLQQFQHRDLDLQALNLVGSKYLPQFYPSAIQLDDKYLTLLHGEDKIQLAMRIITIDLNKGIRQKREDCIIGVDGCLLFKALDKFLISDIQKKVKEIHDSSDSKSNDYERTSIETNTVYSIGMRLLGMIIATLNYTHSQEVEFTQHNNRNNPRPVKKQRVSLSECRKIGETDLTIEEVFPQMVNEDGVFETQRSSIASKNIRYTVKTRDHAHRVIPIWIIPLVIEYLTVPVFKQNLPPISILRVCSKFRPKTDQYNKKKVEAGFNFAERCLNIRLHEEYSRFEELEYIKQKWMDNK